MAEDHGTDAIDARRARGREAGTALNAREKPCACGWTATCGSLIEQQQLLANHADASQAMSGAITKTHAVHKGFITDQESRACLAPIVQVANARRSNDIDSRVFSENFTKYSTLLHAD